MEPAIDITPPGSTKPNVRVLPQQPAPQPLSVSFDIVAMAKSPFFWFVAGAATAWYFLGRKN